MRDSLTRDEVIRRIMDADSEGLDLSREKFRGIDLSGIKFRKVIFSRNEPYHRAKLVDVILRDCSFVDCCMAGADVADCAFRGSRFDRCDFRYSVFRNCTFADTSLELCDFYRADFEGNNIFQQSSLHLTSFNRANLSGTDICRDNFCAGILQENPKEFMRFHKHFGHVHPEEMEMFVSRRHEEAAVVYRSLAGVWSSRALYSDASWAYVRLKRHETAVRSPIYALRVGRGSGGAGSTPVGLMRRLGYAVRDIPAYLGHILAGAICGFGESLSRIFLTYVITGAAFAVLYWQIGAVVNEDGSVAKGISDNFVYSLGNMSASAPERLHVGTVHTELLSALQSLIGVGLIGLLGFVLGNRIRNS